MNIVDEYLLVFLALLLIKLILSCSRIMTFLFVIFVLAKFFNLGLDMFYIKI